MDNEQVVKNLKSLALTHYYNLNILNFQLS